MGKYIKLAFKDLKRVGWLGILCAIFFAVVFLLAISISSAFELKVERYNKLRPYLKQNGVFLFSSYLAKQRSDGGTLLRDRKEIEEYLDGVNDVISMERLWDPYLDDMDQKLETYCLSEGAVRSINPVMEEGRWFQKKDLKAKKLVGVITGNSGIGIHPGDTITLRTKIDDGVTEEIEIIGIIGDKETLFMPDFFRSSYEDFRDCFYVFDNETENKAVLFLYDEQILAGEKDGLFGNLNFRVSPDKGFQKSMTGPTIITFNKNMNEKETDEQIAKIRQVSQINRIFELKDFNRRSKRFVLADLRTWFPLFVFISLFVLVSVVSIHTIMVKKQLGNYAIYYLCGMSWKDCSYISLVATLLECFAAFIIVGAYFGYLSLSGRIHETALSIGPLQIGIVCGLTIMFVLLSHLLPRQLISKTSAKNVLAENKDK